MHYSNIYSLFIDRIRTYRDSPQSVFYVRHDDEWQGISWARFDQEVHEFASALLSLDLRKGGSVAIQMGNVPEWPIVDIATIAAGGVGVGLYPTSSAEQCQYIIDHSDAEFLVVDTRAQLEKVLSVRAALPKLKVIVVLDESAASKSDQVIGYQDVLRLGSENRANFSEQLASRAETADANDIAIMVYTSGTTGPPKGACLSHRYIINSVESMRQIVPIFDSDVAFSYLPYCHVAERISGLYNRLYAGASAYFVDDLSRLGQYMLEVRPTVFASLPRFFEKIHARIVADLEAAPAKERERFNNELDVGRRISRLRQARQEVPTELRTEFEIDAAPVLKKVKDYFGGRIRLATSGGAPLPHEVAEFFDAAGLPILQAYGLTENICVAFNHAGNHKFGTVGPPMPGCEIKIAADGEIMIRSEMMFSGYYKAPEQTAEMFSDGWLLTGDIGEIDDGFLRITGRKKELIVMSTGKKVSPALIENMLKEHHLISHALVYGEGKSYLVALITLNPVEAAEFVHANEITGDAESLAKSQFMQATVQKMIDEVNARVSSSESIKKFAIVEHDFVIEKDEVTPTGKLKREVVTAHHRELIEGLYP